MKKISLLSILLFAVAFVYAQTDVVVTIDVSANADITAVQFKGTPSGWANIQAYDDGTNGDATAGDKIWTSTFTAVACDGTTHEWGAVDQNDTWLLAAGEANRTFVVDAQCLVTGQTSYAIPMVGGAVPVTLTVTDLNQSIASISIKGAYGGWTIVPLNRFMFRHDDDLWCLFASAHFHPAYGRDHRLDRHAGRS